MSAPPEENSDGHSAIHSARAHTADAPIVYVLKSQKPRARPMGIQMNFITPARARVLRLSRSQRTFRCLPAWEWDRWRQGGQEARGARGKGTPLARLPLARCWPAIHQPSSHPPIRPPSHRLSIGEFMGREGGPGTFVCGRPRFGDHDSATTIRRSSRFGDAPRLGRPGLVGSSQRCSSRGRV